MYMFAVAESQPDTCDMVGYAEINREGLFVELQFLYEWASFNEGHELTEVRVVHQLYDGNSDNLVCDLLECLGPVFSAKTATKIFGKDNFEHAERCARENMRPR